jgi:hypothetical protein
VYVDDPHTLLGRANTTPKVSSNAGTDECMALANEWTRNCIANHPLCPAPSCILPTRVIKVGSEHIEPMLHVSRGEQAQYAALSHCWGGSQLLTTTLATLEQRKQGIPLMSLPKTMYEAVITTRKLGLDYLWIDSLCIVQDSTEDWAQESANMAAVYSGATVVIAAEAAQSSTDGCFGPFTRGPWRNVSVAIPCVDDQGLPCKVYARETQMRGYNECEHRPKSYRESTPLPLSTRGWVINPLVQCV